MKARYLSLAPLINWHQGSRPIRWAEVFGRTAPLQVEIGFGNGEFIVRQAEAYPDQDFVGLELEWGSVQRALRKIAQARLTNVKVLQIDARLALERFFSPASISHAYSLFPCPWPKDRHIKYRLFSRRFLQLLNSRLAANGGVQLVTDHQDYRDWVVEQIPGAGFDVQCETIPPRFSTKYERKWQEQGQQQFYEFQFTKQVEQPLFLVEDIPLQTYRVDHFEADSFQPLNQHGEVTIKFRDFIFDPNRQHGMVWVLAVEDGLTQDFWIEIATDKDNRWHIRPARGCPVIPTAGVQKAIDCVRDAAEQPASQHV